MDIYGLSFVPGDTELLGVGHTRTFFVIRMNIFVNFHGAP